MAKTKASAGRSDLNPLWFKEAVIYEVHIKAFCDADGDGMGDFRGMTSKLDYLRDLGVTAIWLLPFCPSPQRDDGYDISDYKSIHAKYGNMREFKKFLSEAHNRGLKVITELVLNHTSDQHPWFQRARRAPAGASGAIIMSGVTIRTNMPERGLFFRISRRRTGPGTRWPRHIFGTDFILTSRT